MDPTTVVSNVKHLISIRAYDSAEQVLSFWVASQTNDTKTTVDKDFAMELLGDIAFEKREYRRAGTYYEEAGSCKESNDIADNMAALWNLRYKESLCHLERKDFTAAIKLLERIPAAYRDEKIQMCLSKLYADVNLRRTAISAHKSAFVMCPWSLDALDSLIGLGVDSHEIASIVETACKGNPKVEDYFGPGWLKKYATALMYKQTGDYLKFVEAVSKLPAFDSNTRMLCLLGVAAVEHKKFVEACKYFKLARKIDSTLVDTMDYYAYALLMQNEESELNMLAHSILGYSEVRPEGWLVVAMFCQQRCEWTKALFFVDKVIKQHPQNAACYRIKGQLMFAQELFDMALQSFSAANNIRKDIPSYLGMVESNLARGEISPAVRTAKEAASKFTRSADILVVLCKALLKASTNTDEPLHYLTKALKIDPTNSTAASLLADIYLLQSKPEDALRILLQQLDFASTSQLRVQIGRVMTTLKRYGEAVEHLQLAITLANREGVDASTAVQEMDKVENIMKQESRFEEQASGSFQGDGEEGEYEYEEGDLDFAE